MADHPNETFWQAAVGLGSTAVAGAFAWLFKNNSRIDRHEEKLVLLQERCERQEAHLTAQDTRIHLLEQTLARLDEVVKAIPVILSRLTSIEKSVTFMQGRWHDKRRDDPDEE